MSLSLSNFKKNKLKPKWGIETKLQIVVSVFAILGISLASILSTISDYIPCVQRYGAEKAVEKIRVTESREYIESVLGIPQQTLEIDYKETSGKTLLGKKSVFVTDYYIFIIYYDDIDTCIGYFLINNDNRFSPKLYDEESIFDLNISESEIGNLGFLSSVGHFANSRSDGSSYHIQYYTHHLALNGCYIGLGFSNLGKIDNDVIQVMNDYSQECNESYLVVTNDNRSEIKILEERFMKMKPNVFSVFCSNDTYDVDELLSRELNMYLSLSHLDLRILI